MRRHLSAARSLALAAGLAASQLIAQNGPAPNGPQGRQGQQGGPGAAQAGPPQTMDLGTAKKLIGGAEAAAAAVHEKVAICVMDTNGDIVLFERMDGVSHIPVTTSQGKARSVLLFGGISTGQIADSIRDQKPISATVKAPPVGGGGGEITVMRGGLPVMKDGKLIGSIAVGGSASENDEKFAQAGLDAISRK